MMTWVEISNGMTWVDISLRCKADEFTICPIGWGNIRSILLTLAFQVALISSQAGRTHSTCVVDVFTESETSVAEE